MTAFNELVSKLEELFEMDKADLDFGIHRIIKSKRNQIRDYLYGSQKDGVQSGFNKTVREKLSEVSKTENQHRLDELKQKIKDEFGNRAFDDNGNLVNEDAKKEDAGKEYLQLFESSKGGANIEQIENEVYSHLFEFFSRYYEEGDFLSLRRHSDKNRYAIPYNGEEVVLHWANKDQYYIKSSEDLKDYAFTIDGNDKKYRVRFHLTGMDAVTNNNKANRAFVYDDEGKIEASDDSLVIPVYFKLTEKKVSQKDVIAGLLAGIEKNIKKEWKTLLWADDTSYTGKDKRTVIEKHLQNYTKKNTSDYFIHKNLKGFLNQELDFYIKNEVMYLDDVDNRSADYLESEIVKIKAIRLIAKDLIDFLAQFEDFQKKLWLKKKFIIETNYCITIDRIIAKCPELIDEIVKSNEQLAEWQRLFSIEEKKLTKKFLEDNQYLVLDTAFFSTEFKYKLLSSMEDIDEETNGLLIHGENFQALNLLQERYNKQIKCIYTDPPYNTNATEIIYKNGYKHSSWNCLIEDRVILADSLANSKCFFITAIDHAECFNLGKILDSIYGEEKRLAIVTVQHNPKGRNQAKFFSENTEYLFFYAKDPQSSEFKNVAIDDEVAATFDLQDADGKYRYENYIRARTVWSRENRPNNWYPIYVSKDLQTITSELHEGFYEVFPRTNQGDFSWKNIRDSFDQLNKDNYFKAIIENEQVTLLHKYREQQVLKNIWIDKKYQSEFNGTNLLKDIVGENKFDFPKSIYAVQDAIKITSDSADVILDYFGGSGTTAHAVINLNREEQKNTNSSKRKYIIVEMGEYFDTVMKPRIQKVVHATHWKNSKPKKIDEYITILKKQINEFKKEIKDLSGFEIQDEFDFEKQRIENDIQNVEKKIQRCEDDLNLGNNYGALSHCFKYIRLENYEDTLNNLELEDRQPDLLGLGDSVKEDYLLRYMLDVETSKSLINLDRFEDPFNATLKIYDRSTGELVTKVIDLPETFNYLLGLRVRELRYRDGFLTYEGDNPAGETVLIIWRNTKDKNNKELEKFVTDTLRINTADTEYRAIYINGDTTLNDPHKKIILTEDVFHKLMFDVREL